MAERETRPLSRPRFVCDVHLGKLAHHLRMLGFDTTYRNNFVDDDLVQISTRDERILLSKDRELLGSPALTQSFFVREKTPRLQLVDVLQRFDLFHDVYPFTRCIECNALLKTVEKRTIAERIPAKVRDWCEEYQVCEACDRIYWKGSHYAHMQAFIDGVLSCGNLTSPSGGFVDPKV